MSQRLKRRKKFEFKHYNRAPVIITDPVEESLERIFGYRQLRNQGKVVYPAFPPFLDIVLDDISKVYDEDEIEFGDYLEEYLGYVEEQKDKEKRGVLPEEFEFVTEPYAHQREAILKCFYNYRWGLFMDTGLGKTKVICDVLRLLWDTYDPDSTALVVCPAHLAHNWKYEITKHSKDGELDVCVMAKAGGNPLDSTRRKEKYLGKAHNQLKEGPYVDEYPLLNYEGFDEKIPDDKYEKLKPHIEDYLEAAAAGDSREQTNARGRIRRRCKKWAVDYPDTAERVRDVRKLQTYDVVVMGYGTAKNDRQWIKKHLDYSVMICDETHRLQTPTSKRTKAIIDLAKKAARRYALTGTPSLGDPTDLWGQMRFLAPFMVKDWWRYKDQYTVTSPYHEHMIIGYQNLHILNEKVSRVATRKKKEECLDLPDRQFIDVPVELDEDTQRAYNELVATNSLELPNGMVIDCEKGARIVKLMQVLSGYVTKTKEIDHDIEGLEAGRLLAKTDHIYEFDNQPRLNVFEDLIEDILQDDDNHAIVWCVYRKELDMVEQVLEKNGIDYVRVDGDTDNKHSRKEYFKNEPDCRVYLSQCSISAGLTLNKANYMIWYGLTYSMKNWKQALGRNYRIGQDDEITVYRLYTPQSIQEYMVESMANKEEVSLSLTDIRKCGTCEFAEECRQKSIEPFDPECIYDASHDRVVTKPKLIH